MTLLRALTERIAELEAQRDKVLARLDSLDEFGRILSKDSAPYVTVTSMSSDDIRAIYAESKP
jgi:hypothetical protein